MLQYEDFPILEKTQKQEQDKYKQLAKYNISGCAAYRRTLGNETGDNNILISEETESMHKANKEGQRTLETRIIRPI